MTSEQIHKGLDGVVIDESELSRVFGDEGRLVFRGYDIDEIAENGDFEETLYLMWYGELPTESEYSAFASSLAEQRTVPDEIMEMLADLAAADQHPMGALQAAVAALAGYDDNVEVDPENDLDGVVEMGQSIAAKLATITAAYNRLREGKEPVEPREDLSHAANFLYMLHGEEPDQAHVEAMDTALQIHMEHGTNASTFTTRVIASTLANPYEAVAGGIGALSGPLHGGANEDVLNMLGEIDESGADVGDWIDSRLDEGGVVYGYGHRVYNVKDPRAYILQEHAETLIGEDGGDDKWYKLAREVESHMDSLGLEEKGIAPNVDFFSGTVYKQMQIPTDIYTNLFTMSRIGGWIGHIIEQYEDNRIIRPRARYVGDVDNDWTPLDAR
ncbi:Citrate synthase [Halanaeroarchaeum sp. HSR-CO]|uniref:citrate/2-methylcitrate synthase n=1 Tax=Halanaeroarchaeum sp. HSR-CO TaxID=2866382 RepID=UPI00217DFFEA|nr:citrate/2-methylcitrate synthase [Halanaeroarchaeum sp. HSR-CO]UWG46668.1 Citrate synthase [Halanaeroarchaeum sp. HSR-CO]